MLNWDDVKVKETLIKEIDERIKEWQDMEDETSREYFSGLIPLRIKILSTGYAEKNILKLMERKDRMTHDKRN